MTKRIVILGGGTGGTLGANRMRHHLPPEEVEIVVVDQNDDHVYQPGLLFVPFGLTHIDEIVRPRRHQLHKGIDFRQVPIESVDIDADTVHLGDGTELDYDVLVVASGSILVKEETEGLTGPGWMEKVFTFYDVAGAAALHDALEGFDGGRVVVNVVDMPIKCPVAPLEFCFLADWYFQQTGLRDRVELTYVTPLDGAFTKPVASRALAGLLEEKGVALVTEFNTGEVDGSGGRLVSYDGREVGFDLAVVVPLHGGAGFVARSPGLGDELGFVPVDEHTLQSTAKPNIFAIGDAAGVPTSKAGSVTHFEGEVLVENVRALSGRRAPRRRVSTGTPTASSRPGSARHCSSTSTTTPSHCPGHFPTSVGLPLLKESRLNHLGKLMFQPLYWHSLLPGRDLPGVGTAMPTRGKHFRDTSHDRPSHPSDQQDKEPTMPTATYAGSPVAVNDEGFFEDPSQWTEAMAPEIAKEQGIDELTEPHWQVIKFMRAEYAEKGTGPTVRVLGKTSGVSIKELYQLFPKGPAKTAAKIAGIPKPRGCI